MDKADIPFLSAVELGRRIGLREISPVEAVEAYLDRIDRVDNQLNSYITVCRDEALQSARQAEMAIGDGDYLGPLHGVPVAVKDQLWTKGVLTTGGSRILADFVPDEDATVISRLKDAGAIILGKLNMSEFATGNSVYHHWGTPRNPWDQDRNPGTSSSGSGAATAAFLCATSLGEDTGGSIRNPATNCGVVGLRPTYGLVSRYGMLGASWSNDIAGPISRSAEDCAVTLQAIAGYDAKDRYSANRPTPDYRKALEGDIKGLKVGIVKEALYADFVQADIRDTVSKAIEQLEELGADVQEVSIPLLPYTASINRIHIEVEAAPMHRNWLQTRADEYDHNVRTDFLTGSVLPAQLYYKAQKLRELIRRQVFQVLDEVDVLALPNTSEPAPLINTKPGIFSKEEAISRMSGRRSLSGSFNLASVPALAVHCGFVTSTGTMMPTALQLAGRPFSDALLLKVAHLYQQATQWHTQRPPI